MIRIDEIYNNIFLQKLQELPYHQMHWFDPFGSVKYSDLMSAPTRPANERAVRYLFWDQEPLHKNLIDDALTQFCDDFANDQCHIVTSERDSETVDYVERTYGMKSHYYFFHGWAALDWFRGYDCSFLMPAPEQRKITTTFISPNRIIGGERFHRFLMFYHMCKNNLLFNHVSFPDSCPAEKTHVENLIQKASAIYPDIYEVFYDKNGALKMSLPMTFAGEDHIPMDSYRLSLFEPASESLLYLVSETVARGRKLHLTEKTFKPICLRMPFVIVGTCGSLRYLRSYGFRTFGDLWDEGYDDEPNDIVRLERIADLLKQLDQLNVDQKQDLFDRAREIVEHNYQHFYGGAFKDILWQELNDMVHAF